MSQPITIRVPAELSEWLASEAKRTGVSPGKLVRDHLAKAKAEAVGKPFMHLAGRIKGPKNLSERKGYAKA
jgi:hypothetical protein